MTGCTDGNLDQEEVIEQEEDIEQGNGTTSPEEEEFKYVENDAWTIEFNSPGMYEGYEYDYVVSVTSTDDNYYFISLMNEDYYQEYDIDALAPQLYQLLLQDFESFNNSYGPGYTLLDICSNESSSQYYPLMPGNQYRAVVLGVSEEGTLSGLYAVSDLITIE